MQTRLSQLFALIDSYCAARGISEGRLSTLVFGSGNRIKMLRNGGDMGSRTIENTFVWFSANWPENAEWPSCVERPAVCASGVPAVTPDGDLPSVSSAQHLD